MSPARRGRRLTVQGWQNLVLSVMGVLVLAGAVAGAVLLNRTDKVSSELVDGIQPARVAAYQLQAALRDQETALRGYAIAADRQFLEPYNDGQLTEQAAAGDIRTAARSDPAARRLLVFAALPLRGRAMPHRKAVACGSGIAGSSVRLLPSGWDRG